MNREVEVAKLGAMYGEPVRRQWRIEVAPETFQWWSARKPEEVCLFVLRRSGQVLLHTKSFYPPGAFRVLTGGVKPQEPLLHAVEREGLEETGLCLQIDRFLATVHVKVVCKPQSLALDSYLFLLHEVSGKLGPLDTAERITAFREVPVSALPSIADQLEQLPAAWQDWGRLRALPHRVAAEVLGAQGISDTDGNGSS